MRKDPKEVPHTNQDLALRGYHRQFGKGSRPLVLFENTPELEFNLNLPQVVDIADSDIKGTYTIDEDPDKVFKLEGNLYLHLEYQSTCNKVENLERFFNYNYYLLKKYKSDLQKDGEVLKGIYTVVIYTCPKPKNADFVLNMGSINFKIYPIFIGDMQGDERFEEIRGKILNGKVLSEEEQLFLLYNPFMKISVSKEERAKEVTKIVGRIQDEKVKGNLFGAVIVMADKLLSKETKEEIIKEVFEMSTLFQEEFAKKVKEETAKEVKEVIKILVECGSLNKEAKEKLMEKYKLSVQEFSQLEKETEQEI